MSNLFKHVLLKWTNSWNPFCYVHPSLLLSPVGDIDSSVHVNCVLYSGYCNHTQCIVGSGPTLKLIQDGGERQVEDRACCRKALNEVFNRKFFFSVRLRRNWCWVDVVRVLGAFIKSSRVTDSCGESRMNSDKEEDCECAPAQAETSPEGIPYR